MIGRKTFSRIIFQIHFGQTNQNACCFQHFTRFTFMERRNDPDPLPNGRNNKNKETGRGAAFSCAAEVDDRFPLWCVVPCLQYPEIGLK